MTSIEKAPIFVTGCTRSGKTLVAAILNKHPELFITFETQIYTALYRRWCYSTRTLEADPVDTLKALLTKHSSRYDISETELIDCLRSGGPAFQEMYHRYMALVISKTKPSATRWGDKTPVDAGTSKFVTSHFPNAQFVYLYRDPRDTVASMSLPDYAPCSDNYLINADVYNQFLREYSKEIYQDDLNILHVRYEALVENPVQEVTRICDFLGISFQNQLLQSADHATRMKIGWENFNVWDEIKPQTVPQNPADPYVEAYLTPWLDKMDYHRKTIGFRQLKHLSVSIYLLPFRITRTVLGWLYQRKYPSFPFVCMAYPKLHSLRSWAGFSRKTNSNN